MANNWARAAYSLAAILFGVTAFVWRDYDKWAQSDVLGRTTFAHFVLTFVALVSVIGGLAVLFQRTAGAGAILLGAIFLFFALLALPRLFATPLVYDAWGNIFEQLSQFCGAFLIYMMASGEDSTLRRKGLRFGIVLFGICVVSFTLEQAFYLSATAGFVPTWFPLGQMFWAVVTTVAFALAAIAIFSGWQGTLAARLTALMILLFVLIIWIPKIVTGPSRHFYWTEGAESLAIAATAWLVADALRSVQRRATA